MKINKFIPIVLFGASMLTACSIDRDPYNSITSEELNSSETSVEAVTLGNYSRLKGWSENWHRLTEYPGDNVALSGTTTDPFFFIYNYQRIPNGYRIESFWKDSYKIIVGANKVIEAIQEGSSEASDQLLAENYFLRALMHFEMGNIFGRPYNQGTQNLSVPLKLDGDPSTVPARATVGEVYDQVEADLKKSISLFTTTKSNAYASTEAAQALLSRLYLFKEDNQQAIEYADKVINSGRFSLVSGEKLAVYPTIRPEDNSETIFAIKFEPDADYSNNGWYTIGSMYANIDGSGWGEMYASRPYLELIRQFPEDQRNQWIDPVVVNQDVIWGLYVTDDYQYEYKVLSKSGEDYTYTEGGSKKTLIREDGFGTAPEYYLMEGGKKRRVLIDKQLAVRNDYPKYYILKASGQEGQAQLWSPVVTRLAEMYLNKAEAYAKMGNTAEALKQVNIIRQRAGIPSSGLYTAGNMQGETALDIVLQERHLELAWEGFRKYDVFRNKRNMDRRYPGTHLSGNNPKSVIEYTAKEIVEFLPEGQTLIHEGLQQNP